MPTTPSDVARHPQVEEGGILDAVIPHVSFDGNCREALEFYHRCMGGELTVMTWDQMPPSDGCTSSDMPGPSAESMATARERKLVMHGELMRGGHPVLMANDVPPGMPMQRGNNISLNIACKTTADIERVYAALSEGGQPMMPLSETFFAERFGMLVDRFGITWMLISGQKSGR
jgi:PhnB protein